MVDDIDPDERAPTEDAERVPTAPIYTGAHADIDAGLRDARAGRAGRVRQLAVPLPISRAMHWTIIIVGGTVAVGVTVLAWWLVMWVMS